MTPQVSPTFLPTESHLRETENLDVSFLEAEGKHLMEVTLIKAGTSRNGNHYPVDVLRESVPLFEGARAFIDHPKPGDAPERSVRDLAGYYSGVHLNEDGRLRGRLHLVPGNEWLFNLLKEAEGNPNLCGLSIDAYGDAAKEGGRTVVTSLRKVESCDIVTRPAAGGAVDRILAADRGTHTDNRLPEENTMDPQAPTAPPAPNTDTEQLKEGTNSPPPNTNQPTHDQQLPDLARLLEQQRRDLLNAQEELSRVRSILNPSPASAPDPTKDVTQLVEEIRRERDMARAESLLSVKLQESILPQPIEVKLRKRFGGRLFEANELDLAIADEKESLAQLTKLGQVNGMGFPEKSLTTGMSEIDQVQAAFDAMFGIYESDAARSLPRISGLREAFKLATGVDIGAIGGADRPLTESLRSSLTNKVRSGQLKESEVIFREADVQTSTFSYLLGTSMNKRLMADYQAWPSEWQKFTNIVSY